MTDILRSTGGLVVLDVDCDYLVDPQGRPASRCVTVLLNPDAPLRPGGILRVGLRIRAG